MALPPRWTIFCFITYLLIQNDQANCQNSPEGCGSNEDLISSLVKELGQKERNLLLNALLSIASNNGIIPDLSPLMPLITNRENTSQNNTVPQTSNEDPVTKISVANVETQKSSEPKETQNYNGPVELPATQPIFQDIVYSLCPGLTDLPYIISTSQIAGNNPSAQSQSSLPIQSYSSSQSSSSSYASVSQSSGSQTNSPLKTPPTSKPSPPSSGNNKPNVTSTIYPKPNSTPVSSSLSSSSQSSSSSLSSSSSKSPFLSSAAAASSSASSSSPPLFTHIVPIPRPLEKPTPSQNTSNATEGKEIVAANIEYSSNLYPFNDEFPINLEINLPAPIIPEPKITIITPDRPATVEKKTSSLKKMLPLILMAMLCNDRNNACPNTCTSPTVVPIPYPIPIPFPSYGSCIDDDDEDSDDTPKKGNRQRREDFDFGEETF